MGLISYFRKYNHAHKSELGLTLCYYERMKRYIARHGHTGVTRDQRLQFGKSGPPLDTKGQKQAKELQFKLLSMGVDAQTTPVVVSEYLRTRQTAELAGFQVIGENSLINEIFTGIPNETLKGMVSKQKLPQIVLDKAQAILDNPPEQKVWITHGLVIMGLRQLLGINAEPFDPPHCEVIELEI